ncbi:hypothetical protein BJX65DRAFT_301675 [Aspergillus insuetus]
MCQVQRVVNSCGHTNDHIIMACRFAKSASPSAESALRTQGSLVDQSRETHNTSTTTGGHSQGPANMIQTIGFDARTEPYCIHAKIKKLSTSKGFKCMVNECGRAD